jgi:hypothetical protein
MLNYREGPAAMNDVTNLIARDTIEEQGLLERALVPRSYARDLRLVTSFIAVWPSGNFSICKAAGAT